MKVDQSFVGNIRRGFVALVLILFILPSQAVASLLSERTYKRLGQIHKLIEKSDYSGALGHLDKLMLKSGDRVYDQAIIHQTYGYVFEAMGQSANAVKAFKSSLDSGELPSTVAQGIRLNLASLYLGLGNNQQALDVFREWLDIQRKPTPEALVFGGSLYAENEKYNEAIALITRAINLSRNPKDTWLRRAAAIYVKMEDYSNAARILSILIEKTPENVSYWKQLSASYYYSGDEKKSLSVMLSAFEKSLLKTEKDILDLAKLAASQNLPLKASQIMEVGLKEDVVTSSRENMELLGNIYIQAKEYNRGIESLAHAANISNDPGLYLRLANLYGELHQWDRVLTLLDERIPELEQLKSRGLLLKGIALYEKGRLEESKKMFREASSEKGSTALATTWLDYLN